MQHTTNQARRLRRAIMRRVYYAYALSICSHRMVLHGMAFSVSLGVFAAQVHVASVIENFLSIPVGGAPRFLWNTLSHGEALTLLAIGVMVLTALSVPWHLRAPRLVRQPRALA